MEISTRTSRHYYNAPSTLLLTGNAFIFNPAATRLLELEAGDGVVFGYIGDEAYVAFASDAIADAFIVHKDGSNGTRFYAMAEARKLLQHFGINDSKAKFEISDTEVTIYEGMKFHRII